MILGLKAWHFDFVQLAGTPVPLWDNPIRRRVWHCTVSSLTIARASRKWLGMLPTQRDGTGVWNEEVNGARTKVNP